MSDRKDAATAATGYSLVAAGGITRGRAVDDAHEAMGATKRLKPSSLAVYRARRMRLAGSARLVSRYVRGSALATVGAPAAAVGTVGLLRHHQQVSKSQGLITQGIQGTGEAWKEKAESLHSKAPKHIRAEAIALGAAGAAGGSFLAHRGLDQAARLVKVGAKTRHALTASAAVPGAVATLPASRKMARKSGYTVTPTGTRKLPGPSAKMSKAAPTTYRHGDYLGRHVTPAQQRVRVMAAGATPGPGVGPIAAAAQAGRYAPPGQRKRAEARQFAAGPVAGGVAGLYAGKKGAQLAEHSPRAERGVRRAYKGVERAHAKLPAAARRLAPLKAAASMSPRKIGAVAGFLVGHAVVGSVGGQLATSRNLAAEKRYNAHHPVSKAIKKIVHIVPNGNGAKTVIRHWPGESWKCPVCAKIAKNWDDELLGKVELGLRRRKDPNAQPTAGQQQWRARMDAHNAKMAEMNRAKREAKATKRGRRAKAAVELPNLIGKALDSTGMTDKQKIRLVHRKKAGAALSTLNAGAGLGALSMIKSNAARTVEHRNKLLAVAAGVGGLNALNSASVARREAKAEKATIAKASPPIQTTMNDKEAHRLVHGKGGYGLRGPLPHGLDRDTRKSAYEARYIASGGKKAQRWQKVANVSSNVSTAGVAGATAAGLALIAHRSPRIRSITAPLHSLKRLEGMNSARVKEKAEHAAVVSATAGGVGQLVNQAAKRRRARYTSAPGGVAASALRRMQAYSPGG